MFCLKQYDTPLLTFNIIDDPLEGQQAHILSVNTENAALMPIGMRLTASGMMSWLRNRFIPRSREFSNAFLSKNGLNQNDTRGILQICRGLSLNDSYWVT